MIKDRATLQGSTIGVLDGGSGTECALAFDRITRMLDLSQVRRR
ncbi:hypothetical protein [Bradyrhizobium cajani]|nr:hypothetical protein [Bradyrhizobium cajani]